MGFLDFLTEGKPVEAVPVSSTQQTILPDWYTNYAMDILSNQQAVAARPFQEYVDASGKAIPRVADFAPDQQAGFEATRQGAFTFRPELGTASTKTQDVFGRSALGAAQPYFGQAAGMSGLAAATPGLQQGAGYVAGSTDALGLQMAQPYLAQAGQTAAQTVGQYMNPYQEQVVNRIGQLGTRALQEQVLPGIESEMIRAGQFGGTRQAEITGRAIRDAIEGISAQQSAALQQGYGQAQQTAQADLARQAQLASTAGGLGGAQQQALLGAGSRMADIGQTYGALTQAQQQMLADLGKSTGALYGQDTSNQLAAAQQMAGLAQQRQQQELAGAGALQQIGSQQQALAQKNLDIAREDFLARQAYPQEQIKAMTGALQGVQPAVPQAATKVGTEVPGAFQPSLLGTIGQAYATYKGLGGK
jgi:hypothetical protein